MPKASEQLPAEQALESMPCVMHVVGHGESLQRIANVCSVALSDLLAANPEVSDAEAVHHNDCIAVPVPAVFPRLYVTQPGDTLHSIARAHEVPVGRLLAKNPELADPSSIQPGWVVALPGLKGDSQLALPPDWLQQASSLPAPDSSVGDAALRAAGRPAADAVSMSAGRQGSASQLAAVPAPAGVATAGSAGQRQRSRHSRQHRQKQQAQAQATGLLSPAGAEGCPAYSQQQQQMLPPVGSGAFLFTVNDSLSGGGIDGSLCGAPPAGLQQSVPQSAKSVDGMHKGGNASHSTKSKQGWEAARGWSVGTAAGYVH